MRAQPHSCASGEARLGRATHGRPDAAKGRASRDEAEVGERAQSLGRSFFDLLTRTRAHTAGTPGSQGMVASVSLRAGPSVRGRPSAGRENRAVLLVRGRRRCAHWRRSRTLAPRAPRDAVLKRPRAVAPATLRSQSTFAPLLLAGHRRHMASFAAKKCMESEGEVGEGPCIPRSAIPSISLMSGSPTPTHAPQTYRAPAAPVKKGCGRLAGDLRG